ncbi:MAG TPA: hypothetical protein DD420_00910 [Streptomyces sp.]|nr:hypothetical protein [Streptomyces sp.]
MVVGVGQLGKVHQLQDPLEKLNTLTLTACYRPVDDQEHATLAADVAYAADRLLTSDPSDSERATAELLNYMAATWDKQDQPLREHAQAVARALRTQ